MNDYWEMWKPEIGQRVCIRITPECLDHAEHMDGKYLPIIQGATGTVIAWGKHEWMRERFTRRGHGYMVKLDNEPARGRPKMIFAAAELDPLPQEQAGSRAASDDDGGKAADDGG